MKQFKNLLFISTLLLCWMLVSCKTTARIPPAGRWYGKRILIRKKALTRRSGVRFREGNPTGIII